MDTAASGAQIRYSGLGGKIRYSGLGRHKRE